VFISASNLTPVSLRFDVNNIKNKCSNFPPLFFISTAFQTILSVPAVIKPFCVMICATKISSLVWHFKYQTRLNIFVAQTMTQKGFAIPGTDRIIQKVMLSKLLSENYNDYF
jgi:hypothetical protein